MIIIVELFGNIFDHLITLQGLGHFVLKFWGKYRRGSRGSCKVKYTKGYENLAFSTNILLYFENGKRCGHSYKMEDE